MALIDVLEKKDIEQFRKELEELLISFEFSVELSFEAGKLRAKLNTRTRSRDERTAMLDQIIRAR